METSNKFSSVRIFLTSNASKNATIKSKLFYNKEETKKAVRWSNVPGLGRFLRAIKNSQHITVTRREGMFDRILGNRRISDRSDQ